MKNNNIKYHLVHLVAGAEHKTALLASQVFDRAQVQATILGPNKPISVAVWVMIPFRLLFEQESRKIIATLKIRCPDINILLVPGIGTLKNWPALLVLWMYRFLLHNKTIYHCRGEESFEWAYKLKKYFLKDAIIVDIRGYNPLERLIINNAYDLNNLTDLQKVVYENDVKKLKFSIKNCDYVCTVSEGLKQMLIDEVDADKNTVVIPCCVKNIMPDIYRNNIRKELLLDNKIAILYLGGVQSYQYLEELVIPYIKCAINLSDDFVGVFITQNKEKMTLLLAKHHVNEDRIRILSVSQEKVAEYITGMDIGLLLRMPSRVINTTQPVKFGEYLSAGIPVILEDGMKNISLVLNNYNIGFVVKLSDKTRKEDFEVEVEKSLDWFKRNKENVRTDTRKFVAEFYTWEANVQIERSMYIEALLKSEAKN